MNRPSPSPSVQRRLPRRLWRWLWLTVTYMGLGALLALGGFLVLAYHTTYPVSALAPSKGGPLLVQDRYGTLLRSVPHPQRPGRAAWLPFKKQPATAIYALLASEDQRFFKHPGVDLWSLLRASWLNIKERRLGYGGSTITMQLMRLVHSQGQPRTFGNKLKEMALALRLERVMPKEAILEQYLNRAYFGRGAYGIEAAAQTYFGKPAASLSVAELSLLCVLPRSPKHYDLLRHLPRALKRREQIFSLMKEAGYLTQQEIQHARTQHLAFKHHNAPFQAPHFVDWILSTLPKAQRQQGGVVNTTLDLPLQRALDKALKDHVQSLKHRGLKQAGVVVLRTNTGEVLAMVGSANYRGPRGQQNILTTRRSPGSALKPFLYAMALTKGDHPGTLVKETTFYSRKYHFLRISKRPRGLVRYREALAGSYNASAMRILERLGVESFLGLLQDARLGPFPQKAAAYGLPLAVGAAKVRLLDLAAAYGFLARQGKISPPRGLLSITSATQSTWHPPQEPEHQLFSPEVSWQIMDILADPDARRKVFGQELPFDLPYPIAAKTGTALGIADTVAIGVTREFTVAAWGGTFDGTPTHRLLGINAAAPLVRAGLLAASKGKPLTLPPAPPSLRKVVLCAQTGARYTPSCHHPITETISTSTPLPPLCHAPHTKYISRSR